MRKSNFGSSNPQRQSVLKPRNADNTPNTRQSSGHQIKKLRTSTEGSLRLSHLLSRVTPVKSSIQRYTPSRSNVPSSNTLAPPPSASRSSIDYGRNSSIGSRHRKDTRPIGDAGFKTECVDKILYFLSNNGCPFQVERRMLLNPLTKNFIDIFNFIYSHIEPNYKLPKKFEEEIPRLLKMMKYPSHISKSSFIPVGSRHTWPSVLAMLAFLIDCIEIYIVDVEYPSSDFDDIDSATNNKRIEKIKELYHCQHNDDKMEELYMDYVHTMELLHEVRQQDIIQCQIADEKLDEEIETLKNGRQELLQLQSLFEVLTKDRDKLVNYNKDLQVHISNKKNEQAQLELQLKELQVGDEKKAEEILRLEREKAKQGLSAEQLAKFKNRAQDIASHMDQLQTQGKELKSQIWSLELTLSKSQKELTDKVRMYSEIVSQLDGAENLGIVSGNISEDIQHLKKTSWELQDYKKNVKQELFDTQKQKMRKDEELAVLQEALNEKKSECEKLEIKLRRTEEDISVTQNEMLQERTELEMEGERLHQQIMEARKENKPSLHQLQNTLDEAKTELEATKAYGKTRMQAGTVFLLKVCHATIEDLDTRKTVAQGFRLDVENYCNALLEKISMKAAKCMELSNSKKSVE